MAEGEPGGLSEAAMSELLDQCEVQFSVMEKLQNEIILGEAHFCENPREQRDYLDQVCSATQKVEHTRSRKGSSICEAVCKKMIRSPKKNDDVLKLYLKDNKAVNRLMATEAELKQWQTVEPTLLSTNSEVLIQTGKEEMLKLCTELEMVLSCCEAKRDKLRETKEIEQKWLEEKKQVLLAASDHIERLQLEKQNVSQYSLLQDTKEKIQKMKNYQEKLMESLGGLLEKHFPLPENKSRSTKKKNTELEDNENLISLHEILEMLMNKALNTPHDPYVTIDDRFWPPYEEMLLRYGIAVRHQENNFKIRLEAYF